MNDKLDNLSQFVAAGFSKIHAALESFYQLLHAANLPKGEKCGRSDDKGTEDQPPKETCGDTSVKELGEASASGTSRGEKEASTQGGAR